MRLFGWRAIFEKELKDNLRDLRSMVVLVAFTAFGPSFLAVSQTLMAERVKGESDVEVVLRGGEHAPELVRRLEAHDIRPVEKADVEVIIPEDYETRMARGETIRVEVIADRSRLGAQGPTQRIERVIQTYGQELGVLRLLLRGVPPSVARPVVADPKDAAKPQARGAVLMGFLAIYFLFSAFIGSMGVSADSAAGERERSSLEVLLAQPILPQTVFVGKWLCATLFSVVSVIFTIGLSRLVFGLMPLEGTGMNWSLGWIEGLGVVLFLGPLCGFASALQLCVSFWAKTYKAASMSLNMLNVIPMVLAFGIMLQEIEPQTWMYAVPVFGHQQMLVSMVRGEVLSAVQALLLMGGTSLLTVALIGVGTFMLTQEKIVFGQSS